MFNYFDNLEQVKSLAKLQIQKKSYLFFFKKFDFIKV